MTSKRIYWVGSLLLGGALVAGLGSGCVARVEGPGPGPAPDTFIVEGGFRHEGYFDDHHNWHGGYYDEHHNFHRDEGTFHHDDHRYDHHDDRHDEHHEDHH